MPCAAPPGRRHLCRSWGQGSWAGQGGAPCHGSAHLTLLLPNLQVMYRAYCHDASKLQWESVYQKYLVHLLIIFKSYIFQILLKYCSYESTKQTTSKPRLRCSPQTKSNNHTTKRLLMVYQRPKYVVAHPKRNTGGKSGWLAPADTR